MTGWSRREVLALGAGALAAAWTRPLTAQPAGAQYIWYDAQTSGRNLFGLFRRTFSLDQKPQNLTFHVFADTHYRLWVNGQKIGVGPIRFDPRFPCYDAYEIAPLLQKGVNLVALEVNYLGMKTYHSIASQPGFIAWATEDQKPAPFLASGPDWVGRPDPARQSYAPKLSFALGPGERYDDTQGLVGWQRPDFDEKNFRPSTVLPNPPWGELSPRAIPFPSGAPIAAKRRWIRPLEPPQASASFSVPVPFYYEDGGQSWSKTIYFRSWIHSPRAQHVPVQVFWGEYFLNQEPLEPPVEAPGKNLWSTQRWPLLAGWNRLFGAVNAYQDILQQIFYYPEAAGLQFRSAQNLDDPYSFERSPLLSQEVWSRHFEKRRRPFPDTENLSAVGGWVKVPQNFSALAPDRATSADVWADPRLPPEAKLVPLAQHPEGFAALYDLGETRLFYPEVALEGVADATVDITYAETLEPGDKPTLRPWYGLADQVRCARDLVFSPAHPRGARYVLVTVRRPRRDIKLDLTLASAEYPVEPIGQFLCSDPALNAIWAMGAKTTRACMEDVYVDTPGRERGLYIRDFYIQYHVNLAAFGDHALMRRCLALTAQSPDPNGVFRAVYPNTGDYTIADFGLNAVEAFDAYYQNTADKAPIQAAWPALVRNLAWYAELSAEHPLGLLDVSWPQKRGLTPIFGGYHGDLGLPPNYAQDEGPHCAFSCMYVMALEAAGRLAKVLGEADRFSAPAQQLKAAIAQTFWSPTRLAYADNDQKTTYSAQASLWAVRAGVITETQKEPIRNHLRRVLRSLFVNGVDPKSGAYASPSFLFYLFDGLYRLELPELAEGLMRQGWGWALAQGMPQAPEYFSLEGSRCHGWSASPTWWLSRYGLGVYFPDPPNLDTVLIQPKNTLEWAEGTYPHPKGPLKIRWRRGPQGPILEQVVAPPGVSVKLAPG